MRTAILPQNSCKDPIIALKELTNQLFNSWNPTFKYMYYSPLNRNIVITPLTQDLLDLLQHISDNYNSMGSYDKTNKYSDQTGFLGELVTAKYLGLTPDFSKDNYGKADLLEGRLEVKASLTPYRRVTNNSGYALHNQHILVKPAYYWKMFIKDGTPENPVYDPVVYVGANMLAQETNKPFVIQQPKDVDLSEIDEYNFHETPYTLLALVSGISARLFHANIKIFTKGIDPTEGSYRTHKTVIDRMSNVDFNHRLACPHLKSDYTDRDTAPYSLERLKQDLTIIKETPKYTKYKDLFKTQLTELI